MDIAVPFPLSSSSLRSSPLLTCLNLIPLFLLILSSPLTSLGGHSTHTSPPFTSLLHHSPSCEEAFSYR